jgi:hypothetical protein
MREFIAVNSLERILNVQALSLTRKDFAFPIWLDAFVETPFRVLVDSSMMTSSQENDTRTT